MIVDLTKNPNCYVYYLNNKSTTIDKMAQSSKYSFDEMLAAVRTLVLKAKDTPARKRFLYRLHTQCLDKYDIASMCFNAINRGKRYED